MLRIIIGGCGKWRCIWDRREDCNRVQFCEGGCEWILSIMLKDTRLALLIFILLLYVAIINMILMSWYTIIINKFGYIVRIIKIIQYLQFIISWIRRIAIYLYMILLIITISFIIFIIKIIRWCDLFILIKIFCLITSH